MNVFISVIFGILFFLYGFVQGANMVGQVAVDHGCATVDAEHAGRLIWEKR